MHQKEKDRSKNRLCKRAFKLSVGSVFVLFSKQIYCVWEILLCNVYAVIT